MTAQQKLDAAIDELATEMNRKVPVGLCNQGAQASHVTEVYILATAVVVASREEREERETDAHKD